MQYQQKYMLVDLKIFQTVKKKLSFVLYKSIEITTIYKNILNMIYVVEYCSQFYFSITTYKLCFLLVYGDMEIIIF